MSSYSIQYKLFYIVNVNEKLVQSFKKPKTKIIYCDWSISYSGKSIPWTCQKRGLSLSYCTAIMKGKSLSKNSMKRMDVDSQRASLVNNLSQLIYSEQREHGHIWKPFPDPT